MSCHESSDRSQHESEEQSLVGKDITRPPSYGILSTAATDDVGHDEEQGNESDGHKRPQQTIIPRSTLACLLLQHTSSAMANNLYHFTTFIFTVEVYKDTLTPASLIGLVTMGSALFCSGFVGGIVDSTPRLQFVRRAVALQKLIIVFSFSLFLILFGRLDGLPAKVFHDQSTLSEKPQVNGILCCTIISAATLWMVNIGINVSVERDWVTTIAQGDSRCLTKLNAYMTSIDLLTRIIGPMVVSGFTMTLGHAGAARVLICIVLAFGALEYFWIQVVYKRFPILHQDQITKRQQRIKMQDSAVPDEDREGSLSGIRGEIAVWREFMGMPVFFSSLAAGLTWLTTLHFDATGVAHFKMAAGYSDIFLACVRGLCMTVYLCGTALMPHIERRIGTGKTGVLGLGVGISCFIPTTISFFLEQPIRDHGSHSALMMNTAVMFGGIIIARVGHVNFDLAQIKSLQQSLEHHPRRNKLTALQSALQSFFSLNKYVACMLFSTADTYKWTVLLTLCANFCALTSYLNYLRLKRTGKIAL